MPLWFVVANEFEKMYHFDKIIITSNKDELNIMKTYAKYEYVAGANTRQGSLANALKFVTSDYVLVHDCARFDVPKDMLLRIIEKMDDETDNVTPYIKAVDTICYQNEYINRDLLKLIQTPQLSRLDILKKAIKNDDFTDESSAIRKINGNIAYVLGDERAKKITYFKDLLNLNLKPPCKDIFSGIGFDVHEFEDKKPMMLGGVKITDDFGFKAHSDGDVLLHALSDALLGAAALGDIGEFFPDTDMKYKNANSQVLLSKILNIIYAIGFEIINVDIIIIAQIPKINPYKENIKQNISKILNLPPQRINLKATTTEKLGFIGRKEGVGVQCVANMKFFDWRNCEDTNS